MTEIEKTSNYFLHYIADNPKKVEEYILSDNRKKTFGAIYGKFKSAKIEMEFDYCIEIFEILIIKLYLV